MKIIAIMSPKGGIGKTTTADSIAYILGEEHEKRVLVIDGDPQGDTTGRTLEMFITYMDDDTTSTALAEGYCVINLHPLAKE